MRPSGVQDWERIEALFHEALVLPAADRAAALARRCGGDRAVRTEIEALLAAHDAPSAGFDDLETSPLSPSPPALASGKVIGRYRIIRVIGSGGMGTVYEAAQDTPARTVALKMLAGAMMTADRGRRFEHEAVLLGRLRHPGIAQVYDAGVFAPDGPGGPAVPFIAMELVPDARPLVRYAEEAGVHTRARLELFARVCDAVQHAHTKGVIHRDLKPANILVDAAGNPQIIDFGIARALGDRPGAGVRTGAHTLLGTVAYMSPEQCDTPGDADARADVFALGVVLYELLCGTLPHAVEDVPLSEAARIIREQPPKRLSALRPILRGDLETITLKALEKDRDRRYQSVGELAGDVRRYLSRRPITARPPTLTYHLVKLVSRNRLASALGCAALLGTLGFTVSVTILYARADAARLRAQAAEREALDQRNRSRAAGRELVAMLQGLDPGPLAFSADRAEEASPNPLETLDRFAQSLDHLLGADPVIHADAMMVLAGQYGRHYAQERAYAAAVAALELRRRELGPRHTVVADTLAVLAPLADRVSTPAEAEDYCREAIVIYESHLPERAADLVRALDRLARLYRHHGHRAAGLEAQRRAYELALLFFGADDLRTADAGMRHAGPQVETGQPEGERLYDDCLRALRTTYGENDLRTLRAEAGLMRARDDAEGWEALMRRVLTMRRDALAPERPEIADELIGLGTGRVAMGRAAAAMGPYSEALEIRRRVFGDRSLKVAETRSALAFLHYLRGEPGRAEEYQRESFSICRAVLGDDHVDTAGQALLLATPLGSRSDALHHSLLLAYAEGHYARTRRLAVSHPLRSGAPLLLGMALLQRGRDAEAEPMLREAVDIRRSTFTAGHPMTAYAAGALAACRARLGHGNEAIPTLAGARAELEASQGPRHLRAVELSRWLAGAYEFCGQTDAAREERDRLERLFPADPAVR